MVGQMLEWMDIWMNRQIDGWMDGQTEDTWMDG